MHNIIMLSWKNRDDEKSFHENEIVICSKWTYDHAALGIINEKPNKYFVSSFESSFSD